jgi:hypothetical protein
MNELNELSDEISELDELLWAILFKMGVTGE